MFLGTPPYELTEAKVDAVVTNLGRHIQGTYVGDSSVNRAIPHGLGGTPSVVIIKMRAVDHVYIIMEYAALINDFGGSVQVSHAVTAMDATNFYVGNAAGYVESGNLTGGYDYDWVAFS